MSNVRRRKLGYAYCLRCQKAIRFKSSAKNGSPTWLKEVARSLSHGEPAALYCISCWLVPDIGDLVTVLDPPYESSVITRGSIGKVVEAEGQAPFRSRFVVEFTEAPDGEPLRHVFYAHQVQAAGIDSGQSLPIELASKHQDDS
jgi:hypothetical protein